MQKELLAESQNAGPLAAISGYHLTFSDCLAKIRWSGRRPASRRRVMEIRSPSSTPETNIAVENDPFEDDLHNKNCDCP